MMALLEGSHFDVDMQAIPIGIRCGSERCDMSLCWCGSLQMVLGEEEIHLAIITKSMS